jgi:hypothetical protein
VLGFGRSGTSLTMRLLNLLSVAVGPEDDLLAPATGDNARGYWEPQWMIDLNNEILATLGAGWQQPFHVAPGWEQRSELDGLRMRAREMLREKFGGTRLWGWKDPRTMLTLPFWRKLVPDAKYVFCVRNPADVISSFQRRPEPNLTVEQWGDLWTEYNVRALSEIRDKPRLLVFYEDLFQNGREVIRRLASFLDLDTPGDDDPRWAGLLGEIDPTLRHHSTSSLELAGTWGMAPAARMLFLALRAAECVRRSVVADGHLSEIPQSLEHILPELWYQRYLLTDSQNLRAEVERQVIVEREKTQAVQTELDSMREILAQARGDGVRLHEEISRQTEQLSLLSGVQAELADTSERLVCQQALMEAVQSSVSWRITSPLRWLKRALWLRRDDTCT